MGLGGMVVMMMGAPDIRAEAGMSALSRSILALDGSSEDREAGIQLRQEIILIQPLGRRKPVFNSFLIVPPSLNRSVGKLQRVSGVESPCKDRKL